MVSRLGRHAQGSEQGDRRRTFHGQASTLALPFSASSRTARTRSRSSRSATAASSVRVSGRPAARRATASGADGGKGRSVGGSGGESALPAADEAVVVVSAVEIEPSVVVVGAGAAGRISLALPFEGPAMRSRSRSLTSSTSRACSCSVLGTPSSRLLHLSSPSFTRARTLASSSNAHASRRLRSAFSSARTAVNDALSSDVCERWNLSSEGRCEARAIVDADEGITREGRWEDGVEAKGTGVELEPCRPPAAEQQGGWVAVSEPSPRRPTGPCTREQEDKGGRTEPGRVARLALDVPELADARLEPLLVHRLDRGQVLVGRVEPGELREEVAFDDARERVGVVVLLDERERGCRACQSAGTASGSARWQGEARRVGRRTSRITCRSSDRPPTVVTFWPALTSARVCRSLPAVQAADDWARAEWAASCRREDDGVALAGVEDDDGGMDARACRRGRVSIKRAGGSKMPCRGGGGTGSRRRVAAEEDRGACLGGGIVRDGGWQGRRD